MTQLPDNNPDCPKCLDGGIDFGGPCPTCGLDVLAENVRAMEVEPLRLEVERLPKGLEVQLAEQDSEIIRLKEVIDSQVESIAFAHNQRALELAEAMRLKALLVDANRGAERNARVNQLLAKDWNKATDEIIRLKALLEEATKLARRSSDALHARVVWNDCLMNDTDSFLSKLSPKEQKA